jgi:hypothetical protein
MTMGADFGVQGPRVEEFWSPELGAFVYGKPMAGHDAVSALAGDAGATGEKEAVWMEGQASYIPGNLRQREDNWRRRWQGMLCRGCVFFVEKPAMPERLPDQPKVGHCRRHAPTHGGWPAVLSLDWCGDYKLDENRA